MAGPGDIIATITGSATQMPSTRQIVQLAQFCRCSVGEVAQLFGFIWHTSEGVRGWRLGPEFITRDAFIRARKPAVCPACLSIAPHLRGIWDVAFYVVCATHRTVLIRNCPGCGRALKWNRRLPDVCGCCALLSTGTSRTGSDAAWLVSQLLEVRVDPTRKLTMSDQMCTQTVERLAALSIDGLLKTLWFIGHCIADLPNCETGHGRTVPTIEDAEAIIVRSVSLLSKWPSELAATLDTYAGRKTPASRTTLEGHLYGPIKEYLESALDTPELAFLRCAYEQAIRQTWKRMGKTRVIRAMDRQLHLDLE